MSMGITVTELRRWRDIENRSAQPPWGTDIAKRITSLANYFASSAGRDVSAVLDDALTASAREQRDAVIG